MQGSGDGRKEMVTIHYGFEVRVVHTVATRHAGTLHALGLAVVLVVSLLSGCQGQPPPQAGSVQLKGSETLRPLLTMTSCADAWP